MWDSTNLQILGDPLFVGEAQALGHFDDPDHPLSESGQPPVRFPANIPVVAGQSYMVEMFGDGMVAFAIVESVPYEEGAAYTNNDDVGWAEFPAGDMRMWLSFIGVEYSSSVLKRIIYLKARGEL